MFTCEVVKGFGVVDVPKPPKPVPVVGFACSAIRHLSVLVCTGSWLFQVLPLWRTAS